jgi:hypothetical protein
LNNRNLFSVQGTKATTVSRINITTNFFALNVSLIGDLQPVAWRAVAKDGADFPPTQQTVRPAHAQQVSVGETYDFMVGPLPHLPRQHLPKLEAGPEQADINRRDGTIYDR